MGVTTVALIDTDSDPDTVDLPIPGNDDSIRSIELVLAKLADACLEGRAALPPEQQAMVKPRQPPPPRPHRPRAAGRRSRTRPPRARCQLISGSSQVVEFGSRRRRPTAVARLCTAAGFRNLTRHYETGTGGERYGTPLPRRLVKQLRDRTDQPMGLCKQALDQNGGDMEKAIEWLRSQNAKMGVKREGNETAEGRIGVSFDNAAKKAAHRRDALRERPVGQERPVRRAGQRPRQARRQEQGRGRGRRCSPSRSAARGPSRTGSTRSSA